MGVVGRLSRMSESGQEAFPDVRKWSGDPRMFRSGRESLADVREWSGGPPGCPGVVGRPSKMSGSGREGLLDVRE